MTAPWRLGAPSFVYPAGWLDNVQRLGPHVQDIEILFFDIDGPGGLPSALEMAGLVHAKATHGLTYTLHTPLNASLASAHPQRRQHGIDTVLRAMHAAAPLQPERTVLHVYLGDHEGDTPPRDLQAWQARAIDSLQAIVQAGFAPGPLCIESLDYDAALLAPLVAATGVSVALDVGHMWRDGIDPTEHLHHFAPHLQAVQCHGTLGTRDHRGLQHAPAGAVAHLLRTLDALAFTGVLTIEVFRPEDWTASHALLRHLSAQATSGSECPHGA